MSVAQAWGGQSERNWFRRGAWAMLTIFMAVALAACGGGEAMPPPAVADDASPDVEADVEPPEEIVEPLPQEPAFDPMDEVAPPLFPAPGFPRPN